MLFFPFIKVLFFFFFFTSCFLSMHFSVEIAFRGFEEDSIAGILLELCKGYFTKARFQLFCYSMYYLYNANFFSTDELWIITRLSQHILNLNLHLPSFANLLCQNWFITFPEIFFKISHFTNSFSFSLEKIKIDLAQLGLIFSLNFSLDTSILSDFSTKSTYN